MIISKKFSQLGRSMIEMLGVLAIIGVLSVGGIAGYSKAMEQYKLNKLKDQYVDLFSVLLQNKEKILKDGPGSISNSTLEALNLLPEDWTLYRGMFTDSEGNYIYFATANDDTLFFEMTINYDNVKKQQKICKDFTIKIFGSMYSMLKEYHIWDGSSYLILYGAGKCDPNGTDATSKCLNNLNLTEISNKCNNGTHLSGKL